MWQLMKNRFRYTTMFLSEFTSIASVIFVVVGLGFLAVQFYNFLFCSLPFGEYRICF